MLLVLFILTTRGGFAPPISKLTSWRFTEYIIAVSTLDNVPVFVILKYVYSEQDPNLRVLPCNGSSLPTELPEP